MQPLRQLWRDSWTKVWGWSKVIVGAGTAFVPVVANVTQDGNVRQQIEKLDLPYIGLALALIGAITLVSMSHKESNA